MEKYSAFEDYVVRRFHGDPHNPTWKLFETVLNEFDRHERLTVPELLEYAPVLEEHEHDVRYDVLARMEGKNIIERVGGYDFQPVYALNMDHDWFASDAAYRQAKARVHHRIQDAWPVSDRLGSVTVDPDIRHDISADLANMAAGRFARAYDWEAGAFDIDGGRSFLYVEKQTDEGQPTARMGVVLGQDSNPVETTQLGIVDASRSGISAVSDRSLNAVDLDAAEAFEAELQDRYDTFR